jgi:hypothetical protein
VTSVDGARRVHLVGTIPARTTHEALRLVIDSVGDRVTDWLPDGETGSRRNWIGRLVENLKNHDDLELAEEGDWSDYESTPQFRVKKGHIFNSVDLDYFEHFEASWPEFQKVRSELGRPGLAFQIGVPGPIDVAFAAFGFNPLAGFRNARPFESATVREVERIHAVAGTDVVYQLEIPIEVEVTNRMPAPIRTPGARWLARRILRVVNDSPNGTRWGFHLCVGDMNNEAYSRLRDAGPAVELTNALVSQFPSGRKIEFIHVPLAHGSIPPTTDPHFYEPLRGLDLPEGVRFIAGFAHELQGLDEQKEVRDMVEGLLGHPVFVASSCGLGRRDLPAATANLSQSRQLVE